MSDQVPTDTITNDEHCFLILVAAWEESPLWEVLLPPKSHATPHEKYQASTKIALRKVIQDGLVEVLGSGSFNKPLATENALALIANPAAFEERAHPPELQLTDKGWEVLRGACFGVLPERQFDLMFGDPHRVPIEKPPQFHPYKKQERSGWKVLRNLFHRQT